MFPENVAHAEPGEAGTITITEERIVGRRRDTTLGNADLRGEHPIIVRVSSRETLARIATRAAAQGYEPTTGEHGDAAWVEVVDPDGICLRFAFVTNDMQTFTGVTFGPNGEITEYGQPRLKLPA